MEDLNIGSKIKNLRQYYKISQHKLCEGICTQPLISKIEANDVFPTAPMLYKISKRLGVDINYFFNEATKFENNYVMEVKSMVDKYIYELKYQEIYEIVLLEKNNPLFDTPALQQYLLWREGICLFHLFNNVDEAINLQNKALEYENTAKNVYSELALDILNSKAVIYQASDQAEQASSIYSELLLLIRKIPYINDRRLVLRIYCNGGNNALDLKKYYLSLKLADEGIKECINEKNLYLLGDFYFLKGLSWFGLTKDKEASLHILDKALAIFEMLSDDKRIDYLQEDIEIIRTS